MTKKKEKVVEQVNAEDKSEAVVPKTVNPHPSGHPARNK